MTALVQVSTGQTVLKKLAELYNMNSKVVGNITYLFIYFEKTKTKNNHIPGFSGLWIEASRQGISNEYPQSRDSEKYTFKTSF